jgi:hypothetical protein
MEGGLAYSKAVAVRSLGVKIGKEVPVWSKSLAR